MEDDEDMKPHLFLQELDQYICEIRNLQTMLRTQFSQTGNPGLPDMIKTAAAAAEQLEALELMLMERERFHKENWTKGALRKAEDNLKRLRADYATLLDAVRSAGCPKCGAASDYLHQEEWSQSGYQWLGLKCEICGWIINAHQK